MPSNRSDNSVGARFSRLLQRRASATPGRRRGILLVATDSFPAEQLDMTLRSYAALDADVRIVAPASNISRLDWLTNDEDEARADAADRAEQVARRVPAEVTGIDIGDSDPVQAAEDVLRVFRPDELIVLRGPEDEERWSELGSRPGSERLDVPVTHVVVEPQPVPRVAEG